MVAWSECQLTAANLELAALPTTTPEDRKRLLSFVVCGGGPTGVEFAAELADMMAEDVLKYVSRDCLLLLSSCAHTSTPSYSEARSRSR